MDKKVCAVVMASGKSKRFGSDKLLEKLGDKTVAELSFSTLAKSGIDKVFVVSANEKILKLAVGYGFEPVKNDDETDDTAITLKLGFSRAKNEKSDGCMATVCDQPFLTAKSVDKLLDEFAKSGDICVSSYGNEGGNPVIFPAEFFDELISLPKNGRGKDVIKRHPERVKKVEVFSADELFDVDTREDFERAKAKLNRK